MIELDSYPELLKIVKTYSRVVGNTLDSGLVELATVSLPAMNVEGAAHAGLAAAAHTAGVDAGGPVAVGVELLVGDTIVHDDNVGAGDDILGVTERNDFSGVRDRQGRDGNRKDLGEEAHGCE